MYTLNITESDLHVYSSILRNLCHICFIKSIVGSPYNLIYMQINCCTTVGMICDNAALWPFLCYKYKNDLNVFMISKKKKMIELFYVHPCQ